MQLDLVTLRLFDLEIQSRSDAVFSGLPLISGLPRWRSRYIDSIRNRRSWGPIPVVGEISRVFQTGLEGHPASCTMGTGSFPEVIRSKLDADHPTPSRAGLLVGCSYISAFPVCLHRYVVGQRLTVSTSHLGPNILSPSSRTPV
jgi:hypothetical protein